MGVIEQQTLALNGIDASTGKPLLRATLEQIASLAYGKQIPAGESEELRRQAASLREDHLDTSFQIDPRNLAETGWGVIFPEGRQDKLREALAPLLALRRSQASRLRESRYRECVVYPGESKARFLARHGVGPGPADPDRFPYYSLIVADPAEISFRFQYQLDVQYAVGRLYFATLEEYSDYADAVVAAERGSRRAARRVSFFGMAHPDDPVTASSLHHLVMPLARRVAHEGRGWEVETVVGAQATKAALAERMGGTCTPALLFTACHGLGFPHSDMRHAVHQGALLCQDWPGPKAWRGPIPHDFYLAADDIPEDAVPAGLIAFHLACYSAGTPSREEGGLRQIDAESFVARLPQRLLGHPRGGALAVIGHVGRAWTSFDWPEARPQLQIFESVLGRLLKGYPIGAAMECFNQRYAELSTDLIAEQEQIQLGAQPDALRLAALWTAAIDARSYAVLGDPAVCLASGAGAGAEDTGLLQPWRRDLPAQRKEEPPGADEVARRQSHRLELAKQEFLQEFGSLASGEDFQGDLGRWRREGKIFAIADREATYVPSFQFDENSHPRPAVARVIQLLGGTTSEWGLALWFAAANGWLDGRRPADLLASAPEEVVEAAEREAEELVF